MAEGVFHTLLGGAIAPSQIENETSAPEVAAWARANNLSRMDCLILLQKCYDGRALLRVREDQLRLDGLSAKSAAALIDFRKGAPLAAKASPLHPSRIFRPAHPVPLGSAGKGLR